MSEFVDGVEFVDIMDRGLWFMTRGTGDCDRGVELGVVNCEWCGCHAVVLVCALLLGGNGGTSP
jgi:hypothetical protein